MADAPHRFQLSAVRDDPWHELGKPVDARLRQLYELVKAADRAQDRRYGEILEIDGVEQVEISIRGSGLVALTIPLMIELTTEQVRRGSSVADELGMTIPQAYFPDNRGPLHAHVSGELTVEARAGEVAPALVEKLALIVRECRQVHLSGLAYPLLQESVPDMQPPPQWKYDGVDLDGSGVIVGIIDDGCAFAHRNFLKKRGNKFFSRVLYLWDQTPAPTAPTPHWQRPSGFSYGWELSKQKIDEALELYQDFPSSEEAMYRYVGYAAVDHTRGNVPTHGTHVMDVAAGFDSTFGKRRGIATDADIIFVQLPRNDVDNPLPSVLHARIEHGVRYIFDHAKTLGKPVVINISYGGFDGPHDGSASHERSIDDMLDQDVGRAVVVAAGNGFEANCHASEILQDAERATKRWIVHPKDPTGNDLEIWYPGSAQLTIEVTPPGANSPLPPVPLGQRRDIEINSTIVGSIDHNASPTLNNDVCILVHLNATDDDIVFVGNHGAAPPGVWQIHIKNHGASPARFDAWIQQNRPTRRRPGRHQQSHFFFEDAHPGCTLGSIATGKKSIAVGGFNVFNQSVARYSACGPTRPTGGYSGRAKPEVCAPAATDHAGRGVHSARILSGLSRRMNGTSIAAPHVAGLIALVLQYANSKNCSLTADEIRGIVTQGATKSGLIPDTAHQLGSSAPYKQEDLLANLIGWGKVNIGRSLDLAKGTCSDPGHHARSPEDC